MSQHMVLKAMDIPGPPANKKRKTYDSHFQDEWLAKDEFKEWLGRVKDDSTKAFCQVCKSEISIAHSGIFDLKTHSKRKAHIRNANAVRGSSKITSFAANDKLKHHWDTVTRAETLFCYALAEHIEHFIQCCRPPKPTFPSYQRRGFYCCSKRVVNARSVF